MSPTGCSLFDILPQTVKHGVLSSGNKKVRRGAGCLAPFRAPLIARFMKTYQYCLGSSVVEFWFTGIAILYGLDRAILSRRSIRIKADATLHASTILLSPNREAECCSSFQSSYKLPQSQCSFRMFDSGGRLCPLRQVAAERGVEV